LFEAYQKHYDSKEPPKGKVIYMIVEGDLVMAFNSYMYPGNKENVACHFLRVWDGEIVEHWDIHTQVPPSEEFQHPNGMY
jgi:predicted SnoaL-like aldol condensation-catalyzing enzyme